MNAFTALLAEQADEPWWIDPKDDDPRDELARQASFLRDARIICPAVDIFARLHEKMTDLHMLGRIEAVYFERPRHLDGYVKESNTRSHLIMVGLTAHILSWVAAMDGVRIVKDVHMATWRGHFIGSMPRATKSAQLKEWAMRRAKVLGFRPAVHDQAEAIGILDYACEVNRIMPYWRQHEVLRPSLDLVM